jgi:hypothetical protein
MRLIDKSEDEWTLGGVTARREKALKELGLLKEGADIDAKLKKILDELGDDALKLVNTLFEGREIKKEELEDLLKDEVKVAVFSFFMSDFKLIERLQSLMPTSILPKSTTQESDNSKV